MFVTRISGVQKGLCFITMEMVTMEMVVLPVRKGNTTRTRPVLTRGHGRTGILVLEVLQTLQSVLACVLRGPNAVCGGGTVKPVTAGNTRVGVLVVVLRAHPVVGTLES